MPPTYCIVPGDLPRKLAGSPHGRFLDDPVVEMIVERRRDERRCRGERRGTISGPPAALERRRIRAESGRRVGERRAELVEVDAPSLPRRALAHEACLRFAQRREPSPAEKEDVDTARLITRLQAGEDELFKALYERYFDRVYAYLRVTLGDPHEAEDVSQEVFVSVLEALPKYERRTVPFRAWVFRIARNAALTRRRSSGRLVLESPTELARRGASDRDAIDPASLEWIHDSELVARVERLPEAQQQVIMLRYLFELGCGEIADLLERKPDAVRQLHSRALRSLRSGLAPVERERVTEAA